MISLVTFASSDMSISAEVCVKSAQAHGVVPAWVYGAFELRASAYYKTHQSLFNAARGAGYFAWKPIVCQWAMLNCAENDILIYADAGLEFIEPVQTIIDLMDQDIWLFGNEHLHAKWCKRDIVEAIWPLNYHGDYKGWKTTCDCHAAESWARFGKQAQASVIFFRVNDYTRAFVKEWLDWCLFEGGRLIDDSPSRTPNHPEFIENRHDQAILTTMAYRDGIKLHEWFVKYEGYTPGRMTGYPRELERPFVFHHRRRNPEWEGVAA